MDAGSRIEGGMTMASARRLAALLGGGQLPKSLEAVGSS
jgi:preprotein translocase subunit SecD